jgi:hypothetical protein
MVGAISFVAHSSVKVGAVGAYKKELLLLNEAQIVMPQASKDAH